MLEQQHLLVFSARFPETPSTFFHYKVGSVFSLHPLHLDDMHFLEARNRWLLIFNPMYSSIIVGLVILEELGFLCFSYFLSYCVGVYTSLLLEVFFLTAVFFQLKCLQFYIAFSCGRLRCIIQKLFPQSRSSEWLVQIQYYFLSIILIVRPTIATSYYYTSTVLIS